MIKKWKKQKNKLESRKKSLIRFDMSVLVDATQIDCYYATWFVLLLTNPQSRLDRFLISNIFNPMMTFCYTRL